MFLTVSTDSSRSKFLSWYLGCGLIYLYRNNMQKLKIFEIATAAKLNWPSVQMKFQVSKWKVNITIFYRVNWKMQWLYLSEGTNQLFSLILSWNKLKRVKNLVKKVIFEWNEKITFFTRFFTRFHEFQLQNQWEKVDLWNYPIERSFLSFICYIECHRPITYEKFLEYNTTYMYQYE